MTGVNKDITGQSRSMTGDNEFKLHEFVGILKRRSRGILMAILLSFIAVFTFHFLRAPEYHAVSFMMINEGKGDREDLFSKVVGPESGVIEKNRTVKKDAELLKSMVVSEMAVKELVRQKRDDAMEIFGARPWVSPLVAQLQPALPLFALRRQNTRHISDDSIRVVSERLNKRIRIEPLKETNLLRVSVASPYPDEAVLLSNTLCQVYKGLNIGQNSEKYAQANRFIGLMLVEQGKKLREADIALSNYMKTHEIYELTGNTEELLKKVVEIDARYNDYQAEYNITRKNLDFLDARLSDSEKEIGSHIAQTVNSQLESIIDQVKMQESEYLRTVRERGLEDPQSRLRKQQLDLVKARYEQLNRSKIAGKIGYIGQTRKYGYEMISEKLQVERKLNDLSVSAREFSRLKQYYEGQLASLPVRQQEYVRLLRDREAISKTYVLLKEKLDESRILLGSEVGNVTIAGAAFKPLEPETPDLMQSVLLGLLFSGVFAGLYTYGAEALDKRVWDVSFFRKNGSFRIFPIPDFSPKSVRTPGVPTILDMPSTPFAESIRSLRAHINQFGDSQGAQTLLVSASRTNEGTSVVCANLAMAMAQAGKRTLIVDCELAHASQHTIFHREQTNGLSDILLGESLDGELGPIQQTTVDNLYLLSAGRLVDNPGDLLCSDRMSTLFDNLKSSFDLVLFDSPPLLQSSSISLSRLADAILLVARAGHALEEDLKRILQDDFYASRITGVVVIEHSSSLEQKAEYKGSL